MSSHKNIDRICISIVAITVVIALVFCNGKALGIEAGMRTLGYEDKLFDNSKVHTIDIEIDNWESFLGTCESELYSACNVVIDGELIKNVGIRGKGNTSLSSVKNMNSSRYSFKLEFDQYDSTKTYHGLDKLCLNNIIQDTTYMKDYLAYTLMGSFGVDAPLCSFVYITVNGEDWGLYLAVEAIEDSFLERNYGASYGDLYKPDSMSFGGGGPGNGKNFSMSDFINENTSDQSDEEDGDDGTDLASVPDKTDWVERTDVVDGDSKNSARSFPGAGGGGFGGFGGFGMGSDDVKLKYIDDDPDSYQNIFGNAKTTVNRSDKNRLISSLKALSEQTDIEDTVDVEEVIRYFVVHVFLCNGDSYTGSMIHNYYLYEKNGQLSMIPWDYNLAYGSFQGGNASSSVNSAIDTPVSGDMSDRPMIAWIFDNEEYTEKYHEYFKEFLSRFELAKIIEDTAALIDEYVEKDPTKFCTYEEFKTGVETIKKYCELRSESVSGQLAGTIPSTSSGQSADSSSLIDTTGISISAMGSMGGGTAFGGGNRNGSDGNMPEGFNLSSFGGGNMPEGFDPSGFGGGKQQRPDSEEKSSQEEDSVESDTPENGTSENGSVKNDASENGSAKNGGSEKSTSNETGSDSKRSSRTSSDRSSFNPGSFTGMSGQGQNDESTEYILLGVSAFILLVGVLFAAFYKRRK
jgi:spore coat protein CotH